MAKSARIQSTWNVETFIERIARNSIICTAAVALGLFCATRVAQAQTVDTWDGGDGSTTDITAAMNWVGDVAPSITTAGSYTDALHFGPATFTTVQSNTQLSSGPRTSRTIANSIPFHRQILGWPKPAELTGCRAPPEVSVSCFR